MRKKILVIIWVLLIVLSQTSLFSSSWLPAESITDSAGKDTIDENLGNNIISVILANDYTATYDASAKAKIIDVTLTGSGFEKNVSENLLIGENMEMIQANPTTDVKQMVIHRATNPSEILQNVRFKANLTKGVDADARILIVRKQFI